MKDSIKEIGFILLNTLLIGIHVLYAVDAVRRIIDIEEGYFE